MVAEEYVFGETRRVSLCLQRGHCIDIGRHWRENSTGKSVIGISSSENRTIQNENGPQGPVIFWSGRRDLNPRPPAPQADALPGCATPRLRADCSRRPLALEYLQDFFQFHAHLAHDL